MREQSTHIFLFNDERYQQINLQPGQRLFRFDYFSGERLVGTLSGVVEDQILMSGHSAPFGGLDFVRSDEAVGVMAAMIEAARADARRQGIMTLRIKIRPAYYGANDSGALFALLAAGAKIETCELSLGLKICRYRDTADYVASLKPSSAHKLRQAQTRNTAFGVAASAAEWSECFALLAEARRRRGAQLKIGLDYVLRMRQLFGERIAMYRLVSRERVSAAALVYRTSRDVDQVVAWGDDAEFRKDRVMNLMAYHLVCNALAQKVRLVDLGISSVGGLPDDGLIQFKRNIGAETGLRIDVALATADAKA